jgi:hypothetical protein
MTVSALLAQVVGQVGPNAYLSWLFIRLVEMKLILQANATD